MRRLLAAATMLLCLWVAGPAPARAQSIDDLKIQVHGYATQGFLYSTNNNWDSTNSSEGSAAWTEAVVNLTATPQPKLHVGVQARSYLLGNYGNAITLDWAQADYKVDEYLGFRVGKVKTPIGLLNETQDIDPAYLWVLLPQSIYTIGERNSTLAHYGGVVYGQVPSGESFGKLEYRAFGGQRVIGTDDSTLQPLRNSGMSAPNGIAGPTFGGTLRWVTPLRGLFVGASENSGSLSGAVLLGPMTGSLSILHHRQTYYFAKYERNRIMLAGEYSRYLVSSAIQLPSMPTAYSGLDERPFYAMASYKLNGKLTAGLYYSSDLDRRAALTSARYQKDWTLAARYDFNPFLYLKAEQHWMDGTLIGYSTADNLNLQPNTHMTLLKLGVSF
jgi:hypothetical protein